MTTYTVAVRNYPTKKSFMEAVKAGRNISLFGVDASAVIRATTLREIHDRIGYSFTVTNTTRSWFAEVTVKANRKLKVT